MDSLAKKIKNHPGAYVDSEGWEELMNSLWDKDWEDMVVIVKQLIKAKSERAKDILWDTSFPGDEEWMNLRRKASAAMPDAPYENIYTDLY